MLLAWDFFWQQTESRLNPDGKHKKYGMRLGVERYLELVLNPRVLVTRVGTGSDRVSAKRDQDIYMQQIKN
jgi:hypothetical protein